MRKSLLTTFLISILFASAVFGAASAAGSVAAAGEQLPEGFFKPVQDVGGPRGMFSIEIPDDPLIEHYISEYSTDSGQKTLSTILKRGTPYIGFIYNMLVEAGLPPELMYLPAIESGFSVWAVSKSGASGLWQFMQNSIAPYDIEINEWQDDRRDFWKATAAAVDKLKYNYERTGSWPLAVAAYNCGLGRIERAVKAAGTTNYIELYEQGYIPRETRNYLPKFFAVVYMAAHASDNISPASAVMRTADAETSSEWERLELNQAVNLVILASKTGIPLKVLHEANAELTHGISPPAGSGYFLKVPARYSDNVRKVLEHTADPLMRFYIHEIRGGDTYYALSRHFGIPVSMIEMYNPGVDARSLRSGQKIIIPALKETEPYRNDYTKPELWDSCSEYVVAAGDSLWGIARRFGVTVEELTFNNGIESNSTLKIGAIIKVPQEN